MPSSIDRPVLEEPWAKRLRTTRSRSVRAGQEHSYAHHLPSPKTTGPSSTDDVPSSLSSAGYKTNLNLEQVQSLRERLVPPPKPAPTTFADSIRVTSKKATVKPSVAPFFQRIEAAFQDKPNAASKPNQPANATARGPARSPSPDAEDLIQQLKEHYLQTATTLHQRATIRLSQTHGDLACKLTQSLVKDDEAFLAETEARIKMLAQPLDKFRIRSQQRSGADGTLRSAEKSVGELVARAEEQVREFERDVAGLWEEWAVAEQEVKGLLKGFVSAGSVAEQVGGGGGSGGGVGEEEGMLERFREAIEREIGEAEREAVEFGEEAVGMMKVIEKDFRKATLPDLHTFFQSIDEP